jgi:hypothetical protein
MEALGRVLAEEGLTLTSETYFAEYLALDDRGCFEKAFSNFNDQTAVKDVDELIRRKGRYVEAVMQSGVQILPGAGELIRLAANSYPLGDCLWRSSIRDSVSSEQWRACRLLQGDRQRGRRAS